MNQHKYWAPPSLDMHDSPRATSNPARSINGKCPIQMYHFLSFISYFYSLDMFIYTNTKLPILFSTVTCYTVLKHRSNGPYHIT